MEAIGWRPAAPLPTAAPAKSVWVSGDGALAERFRRAAGNAGVACGARDEADLILIACDHDAGTPTEVHTAHLDQLQSVAGCNTPVLLVDDIDPEAPGRAAAWRGGAAGLAKTAAREWPDRSVAMVHVPDADDAVLEQLFAMAAGLPVETLFRGNSRFEPALEALTPSPAGRAIGAGDVFLVTGGGRGVTADCVVELARCSGARFMLAGRSRPVDWPQHIPETGDLAELRALLLNNARASGQSVTPKEIDRTARALLSGRDIHATLSAIEQAGASADYIAADVSSPEGAERAVAAARERFGRVTGLIHGAGVLADKRIEDKTPEQLANVFAPKVEGLRHLLDHLQADELDHIALFSSVSARFGNAGQADYAMANEVLNRVARALKAERRNRTVVSFNWGPWAGGMVSPELARHFEAQGVKLLSRTGGADAFARLMGLGADAPVEAVVAG